MTGDLAIRPEQPDDFDQIERVIAGAFLGHPHSDQSEHHIVSRMRDQGGLSVGLVAAIEQQIVGHIAFSEVTIDGKSQSWYGLAPVAVDAEFQRRGIGSKLVRAGINAIKQIGARGCVLLGEPAYEMYDFVGRFH